MALHTALQPVFRPLYSAVKNFLRT